ATTSGGSGGCIPTLNDNVHFDANSFSASGQVVTVDAEAYCHDMDWTGVTNTPEFTTANTHYNHLNIHGSLTMATDMIWDFNVGGYQSYLRFRSTDAGETITMNGQTFDQQTYFEGVGGEWNLQDAFSISTIVHVDNGTFNTNNQDVTAAAFYSSSTDLREVNLGSSLITLTGGSYSYPSWNINATNMTLDATNAVFMLTSTGGPHFRGAGFDYNTVSFTNGSSGSIDGNGNTFNSVSFASHASIDGYSTFNGPVTFGSNLQISNSSGGYHVFTEDIVIPGYFYSSGVSSTYRNRYKNVQVGEYVSYLRYNVIEHLDVTGYGNFRGGNSIDSLTLEIGETYEFHSTTDTIQMHLEAVGSCQDLLWLRSYNEGTQQSLYMPAAATMNVQYANIRDLAGIGGANFEAFSSTDLGNNAGWTINAPTGIDLYWVGGTGNWNDAANW
ncbi:MAG: hypothetical protein H6546_09100, partial [Chitinophagales bacterium]|nr:hypothetical protein [Chitinophagales bacterium]